MYREEIREMDLFLQKPLSNDDLRKQEDRFNIIDKPIGGIRH
jgi:hypothetical protein